MSIVCITASTCHAQVLAGVLELMLAGITWSDSKAIRRIFRPARVCAAPSFAWQIAFFLATYHGTNFTGYAAAGMLAGTISRPPYSSLSLSTLGLVSFALAALALITQAGIMFTIPAGSH